LDEIIRLVQAQLQVGLDPKQMCARFTGTLSAAEHPFFCSIPLFLKHWILNVGDILIFWPLYAVIPLSLIALFFAIAAHNRRIVEYIKKNMFLSPD